MSFTAADRREFKAKRLLALERREQRMRAAFARKHIGKPYVPILPMLLAASPPEPVRTLTAIICGDPLPGRSALDQKRNAFEKMFLP